MIVEGQTEETFINRLVTPLLAERDIFVDVHTITTGRRRGVVYRGGFVRYEHLVNDLSLWMRQDNGEDSWFSTMVDYFRIPNDFPGFTSHAPGISAFERAKHLEECFLKDMRERLAGLGVANRFIPYVQMHEFEALLFSGPSAFEIAYPGQPQVVDKISAIAASFDTPEHINDGPETSPSRRIINSAPAYQKAVAGPLIAQRIGIAAIRQKCQRFNKWLCKIENLAAPS